MTWVHTNISMSSLQKGAQMYYLCITQIKVRQNWEKLDEKTLKFHQHEDQLASYQEVEDEVTSLQK